MEKVKKQTIVTAGSGYRSIKSTERYTPDTAPINYQSPVTLETQEVPSITLTQDKPKKELNIQNSFLDSIISIYVSGQHSIKGRKNLRIREVISLIIHNIGLYRVVVNSPFKQNIIDIIENGSEALLGERINKYDRTRIVNIFKRDNTVQF